jgi:hypothetical protein
LTFILQALDIMDPVSAFRVAGTVVTFVDFCYSLVSESIEIYRSPEGISSENFQLSTLVKDLGKISTQVSDALDTATSQALVPSDESLVRLCQECESITAEVNSALAYLQAQGGGSKAMMAKNSVTVALKAMWSKGNLQNIEKRLQQIRSEMTMAMLVSLWYVPVQMSVPCSYELTIHAGKEIEPAEMGWVRAWSTRSPS